MSQQITHLDTQGMQNQAGYSNTCCTLLSVLIWVNLDSQSDVSVTQERAITSAHLLPENHAL